MVKEIVPIWLPRLLAKYKGRKWREGHSCRDWNHVPGRFLRRLLGIRGFHWQPFPLRWTHNLPPLLFGLKLLSLCAPMKLLCDRRGTILLNDCCQRSNWFFNFNTKKLIQNLGLPLRIRYDLWEFHANAGVTVTCEEMSYSIFVYIFLCTKNIHFL